MKDRKIDYMVLFCEFNDFAEAKQLYLKLALANHPDRGGDVEVMKCINTAFDSYINAETKNKASAGYEIEKDLMEKINKIIHLDKVKIEVLGKWIWVTGDTKPNKEIFKKEGFFFARKKIAWYYRKEQDRCRSRGMQTMNEIRTKYGATDIKTQAIKKLK